MLGALLTFDKYETTNYDVCGMRRYSRNILQLNKNDIKRMKMTTRDYSQKREHLLISPINFTTRLTFFALYFRLTRSNEINLNYSFYVRHTPATDLCISS